MISPVTSQERAERTAAADELCQSAYAAAGGPDTGVALVAVGGYGRGELAPYSDLDVVLVHDEGVDLGDLAEKVWYPLWDAKVKLDHSIRTLPEMLSAAEDDPRVALGLLDVRHLAGDTAVTLRLRSTMLNDWRQKARQQLPALRELTQQRHRLLGEIAHESIPDLKEMEGGLRDGVVMKGIVATWLVDVPHVELERSRQGLLDVRDVVQGLAGRATDRIVPEWWGDIAVSFDFESRLEAQRYVRQLGRRVTHLSRLSWRRVDDALVRGSRERRPQLTTVASGVALSRGEIVLDGTVDPEDDAVLLLRAAAEAAGRGIVLSPASAGRLARESRPLPNPWPDEARHQFVRLLAAGRGLLHVWETLEETGALGQFLPEWEEIRLLPHATTVHQYTVDRHSIETAVGAAALIRRVARPDVLLVTALLHDIGKGSAGDHSIAGAPVARAVAARMGFDADAVAMIELLVRYHLLLATLATTRDPSDPVTIEQLLSVITTVEVLDLLAELTEADALATGPKAWTTWRASLIRELAANARQRLDTGEPVHPEPPHLKVPREVEKKGAVSFAVEQTEDGARLTVMAKDRVGLMADVAAVLALQRVGVRACRLWSQGDVGVSQWEVADESVQASILQTRFQALLDGRLDAAARLRPSDSVAQLAPAVVVRPGAATDATVLEFRAADRPGTVYVVAKALAALGITVRSAHLSTLGPQAVDVFYLQEPGAGALSRERAQEAVEAVRAVLAGE